MYNIHYIYIYLLSLFHQINFIFIEIGWNTFCYIIFFPHLSCLGVISVCWTHTHIRMSYRTTTTKKRSILYELRTRLYKKSISSMWRNNAQLEAWYIPCLIVFMCVCVSFCYITFLYMADILYSLLLCLLDVMLNYKVY